MGLAGGHGKGRGRADQLRPAARRRRRIRESAGRSRRSGPGGRPGVHHREGLAGGIVVGFAIAALAVADVGIEEVQLVVAATRRPWSSYSSEQAQGLPSVAPSGSSGRVPASSQSPSSRAPAGQPGQGSRPDRAPRPAPARRAPDGRWRRSFPAAPPGARPPRQRVRAGARRRADWPSPRGR